MNRNKIITGGIIVALLAGLVFYLAGTSAEPETDKAARIQQELSRSRSLEIEAASDEAKAAFEKWKSDGFIIRIDKYSHQVWLDLDQWRELTREEMEGRIKTIGEVFSEVDGTFQVIAREPENNMFLADYFASAMRLNEDYINE
jgi:hypothetical protein